MSPGGNTSKRAWAARGGDRRVLGLCSPDDLAAGGDARGRDRDGPADRRSGFDSPTGLDEWHPAQLFTEGDRESCCREFHHLPPCANAPPTRSRPSVFEGGDESHSAPKSLTSGMNVHTSTVAELGTRPISAHEHDDEPLDTHARRDVQVRARLGVGRGEREAETLPPSPSISTIPIVRRSARKHFLTTTTTAHCFYTSEWLSEMCGARVRILYSFVGVCPLTGTKSSTPNSS